jgi:hypothetical protein
MHLEVSASFGGTARRFEEDPLLRPDAAAVPVRAAMMGDIVAVQDPQVAVRVRVEAAAPIERIDLRIGSRTIETIRPYRAPDLGRRVRVVWEGAEYRGRGRMTTWDGRLRIDGNRIESFRPINFWHLEKTLERTADGGLAWQSVTTGNFAGADITLARPTAGHLEIETPHLATKVALAEVGLADTVQDAGGLGRALRIYRLPDANPACSIELERSIRVAAGGDTPLYVRVTLENGHQAWSSPIYLFMDN